MKVVASALWTLFLVHSILLSCICNTESADIDLSQQCLDGSCISASTEDSNQQTTKIPIQLSSNLCFEILFEQLFKLGSICGTSGRAVASNTREPRVESSLG